MDLKHPEVSTIRMKLNPKDNTSVKFGIGLVLLI